MSKKTILFAAFVIAVLLVIVALQFSNSVRLSAIEQDKHALDQLWLTNTASWATHYAQATKDG